MVQVRIFLIFLLFFSFFSSCSKSDNPNEIEFWHFWSEPYQRKVLDSIIYEFQKETGIKVIVTPLSWSDGKLKLQSAFNSKTAPDVLELGSDWVPQYSSEKVLMNLNNHIKQESFLDFTLEPGIYKDSLYAIPWIIDTRVLFINSTLLNLINSDTPKSLEDILNICENFNIQECYCFGINGSDKHRLYKKIISLIWSNGTSIIENDRVVLNKKEIIESIELYNKLSINGIVESQKELDNLFASGKLLFWVSGSWLVKKISSFDNDFEYILNLIPGMNENSGISFTGGEYLAVNNGSTKKKAALKFIKFMTNGKNSVEFCKNINEAGFPADIKYFNDSSLISNKTKKVFSNQLQYSKMTPNHPKWLEIEEILENAVEKVIYGSYSAEKALEEAQITLDLKINRLNE